MSVQLCPCRGLSRNVTCSATNVAFPILDGYRRLRAIQFGVADLIAVGAFVFLRISPLGAREDQIVGLVPLVAAFKAHWVSLSFLGCSRVLLLESIRRYVRLDSC